MKKCHYLGSPQTARTKPDLNKVIQYKNTPDRKNYRKKYLSPSKERDCAYTKQKSYQNFYDYSNVVKRFIPN